MTVYARIGNLSEGGLFLRTSTPLPAGTQAVVRLKDGDLEEVSAPVTVVWTRETAGAEPAGMGLQFGPVEERVKEAIRRMVQAALGAAGQ